MLLSIVLDMEYATQMEPANALEILLEQLAVPVPQTIIIQVLATFVWPTRISSRS
jgi:hypothetical protein